MAFVFHLSMVHKFIVMCLTKLWIIYALVLSMNKYNFYFINGYFCFLEFYFWTTSLKVDKFGNKIFTKNLTFIAKKDEWFKSYPVPSGLHVLSSSPQLSFIDMNHSAENENVLTVKRLEWSPGVSDGFMLVRGHSITL